MATTGFRRFLTGIGLIPKVTSTAASKGEMDVTTSDGKINYHNGTSSSPVVTEAHSATLTNKTLTSPVINTPTGIVKGDVGLGNVDNTSDATKNSATATLTNKTIDGGSNTLTNLPGSAISGTVAITNGGTGQTTQQTALDALAGAVTSAQYLRGDGAHVSMSAIQASDVPTLNQNTTGTAANVTATSNSTLTTLSALSLPGSQVSGNISGNATNVTGTVAVANGGTGQTSTSAAFNALAPTVSKGDIIVRNSTTNTSVSVGTDGQVLVADASQSTGVKWTTLQQGSKNYISNGTFEANSTTGWNTFTTTMTGVVPTGTISNGAAGITIFQPTSTNPLAGTYSLQVQGSPTFPAGQGFYTQFTPDREDRAKVLQISFNYEFVSATGSSDFSGTSANTFHVYIYDVTNSAWIQPAGVYGMTQNSGAGKLSATFQTNSTATTYNLVVLCANTASGTTTMNFDDFSVGPQIVTQGATVSDFQSFTPTGSVSGSVAYTGFYRRVGDSLEMQVRLSFTGSASFASSQTTVNLPSGLTIDTAKLVASGNDNSYGFGSVYHGTGASVFPVAVGQNNSTSLFIGYDDGTDQNNAINNSTPGTFQSGGLITFTAKVPIVGWSSNVQLSSDTDTRVVTVNATSPSTTTTANTNTGVVFTSTVSDTHGSFNTSTGVYTVAVSGYYDISAYVGGNAASWTAGERLIMYYRINSTDTEFGRETISTTVSQVVQISGSALGVPLKAGDTVQLRLLGEKAITLFSGFVSLARQSGPATIAASETVAASYSTVSSTTYTTPNALIFTTKVFDTHGTYNTSTGVFIVPVSGIYRISATGLNNSTSTINFAVYVNGVSVIGALVSLQSGSQRNAGSGTIKVKAGDAVTLVGSTSVTMGTSNSDFFIERIGN